jgi:hypothetical protein
VTDATGAVVPRAQVTVIEQETAVSSNTVTTESGAFTIPYLSAGRRLQRHDQRAGVSNSQQSGSYSGSLGSTTVTPNPSIGLQPGMGRSDTCGTIGSSTFPPRKVVMNLRLRF